MPRTKNKVASKRKSPVTKKVRTVKAVSRKSTSAGNSRAEGIRLFNLAGRPTKQQFQLVYGDRGHLLTWDQRAEAGVPAEKFQATLAAKQSGQ